MMKTPSIERSHGLDTGYLGILCGSGYEGATTELDATVWKAATLLAECFGQHDIEIRFNSDRRSGGAWLKNSLKGFAGNCQVGLCAGLRKDCQDEELRMDFSREGRAKYDTLPDRLYVNTYVDVSALTDPSLATEYHNTKSYVDHDNLDAAIEWLKANINRDKIED